MRREKTWISVKEIFAWTRLTGLVITNEDQSSASIFSKRVISLVERNGWKQAFNYLKECFRIVVHLHAGQPVKQDYTSGLRVKVDSHGFPKILPASWRVNAQNDVVWLRFILTTLQIFRVFPYAPQVKQDSIQDPFSGIVKTLPRDLIQQVAKALRFAPTRTSSSFKLFVSEKAGPNFRQATHSAFLDALAFWNHLDYLLVWLRWSNVFRGFNLLYVFSLLSIMILGLPLYIVYSFIGVRLKQGKLSVVRDQAGKARVVAIANYWTQIALRPLHDYIFSWLRGLETDGTFDQQGALTRFIERCPQGIVFHSIDLTAATDRIPVEFLAQILDTLGFRGSLWRRMLDLTWWYKTTPVKYSVGQGMGAYSSWAMLAVFNHFLVRIAAQRCGLSSDFNYYVVLGDDVVIAHHRVALQYRQLLDALGVKVSEGKCLTSSKLCEFAKQLRGHEEDITPLGAGLILNFLRYRLNIYPLLLEMYRLGYLNIQVPAREFLSRFPSLSEGEIRLILAAAFNPGSHVISKGHGSLADVLFDGAWNPSIISSLYQGLLTEVQDQICEGFSRAFEVDRDYYHNWYKHCPSQMLAQSYYERMLYQISPSFWAYTIRFMNGICVATEAYEKRDQFYLYHVPREEDLENLFGVGIMPVITGKSSRESRLNLKRVSRVFRYSFIDKRQSENRLINRKPVTFDSSDWI